MIFIAEAFFLHIDKTILICFITGAPKAFCLLSAGDGVRL